jgi:hypothetical protein
MRADTVAQWLFDEGGGLTILDSSGNNHHGTMTFQGTDNSWTEDSPFEPDDSNGSLAGVREIRVPNAPDLNPTGAFTIEAWVKFAAIPGQNPYIISKRGLGPVGFTGYWLEVSPGPGFIEFATGNGVGEGISVASANLGEPGTPFENMFLEVDTWYHIAGVHTGTENIVYVNGITNGPVAAAPMVGNSDILTLGYFAAGDKYGNYLSDDFRISDSALLQSELGYHARLQPADNLGDFNGDQVVNGADFLSWQRGDSPNALTAGDLTTWKYSFGNSYVSGAGAVSGISLPEPTSVVLMLGAFASMTCWRRQSRA